MGQIYYACAYDIDTKTCNVVEADKFHANCYSCSSAVLSTHYLLRQKPYRVMWGGNSISSDDNIEHFLKTEDLLGISTYLDYESFERCNEDLVDKKYFQEVLFIDENSKQWNRRNVEKEAYIYFNWPANCSVRYSGYLLNHTKKLAVDLANYYYKSKYFSADNDIELSIDLIPVLTDNGNGAQMAYFDGVSAESTEKLAATWCGDLLEITNYPRGYKVIDCCFADIWERARYCHHAFGTNKNGYVYGNCQGDLYEAAMLSIWNRRVSLNNIKVDETGEKVEYIPIVDVKKSAEYLKSLSFTEYIGLYAKAVEKVEDKNYLGYSLNLFNNRGHYEEMSALIKMLEYTGIPDGAIHADNIRYEAERAMKDGTRFNR